MVSDGWEPKGAKGMMMFLHRAEWECAVDDLWASLFVTDAVVGTPEHDRLVALARRVGTDLARMARDLSLRRG